MSDAEVPLPAASGRSPSSEISDVVAIDDVNLSLLSPVVLLNLNLKNLSPVIGGTALPHRQIFLFTDVGGGGERKVTLDLRDVGGSFYSSRLQKERE